MKYPKYWMHQKLLEVPDEPKSTRSTNRRTRRKGHLEDVKTATMTTGSIDRNLTFNQFMKHKCISCEFAKNVMYVFVMDGGEQSKTVEFVSL
jgi:hypothetical protein